MTTTEERFSALLKEELQLLDMLMDSLGQGTQQFDMLLNDLKENDRRRVHILRKLHVELASRWAEACRV